MADPLVRAQDLLRLAVDKANAKNSESGTAALALAKHLQKHGLLDGRTGTTPKHSKPSGTLAEHLLRMQLDEARKENEKLRSQAEFWEGAHNVLESRFSRLQKENQQLVAELSRQKQVAAICWKTYHAVGIGTDPDDPSGLTELKRLVRVTKIAKEGRDSMERDLLELFDSGWTGGADAAAAKVGRRAARVRQCIARLVRSGQLRCSGSPQRRKYSSPLKGQRTEQEGAKDG